MKRDGNTLRDLGAGAARRLPDGRNAFRKMSAEQRATFLAWIIAEYPADFDDAVEAFDALRDVDPLS